MRRIYKSLLFMGVAVASILLSYVIGFKSPYTLDSETISGITQILLIAKASIIAIIFSAIFVTTQVISSRYSPEFISVFIRSSLVRHSFLFGISSITLDIILLVILSFISERIATSIFVFSVIVAIILLISLYLFMSSIFERLTPVGLLDQYKQELSTQDYINKSIEAAEEELMSHHPVQPVYDLTRNSIDRSEITVAVAGEKSIFEISDRIVSEIVYQNKMDQIEVPDNYSNEQTHTERANKTFILFEPVIDYYLPNVADISADEGYTEIIDSSTDHLGALGIDGVKCDDKTLANMALVSFHDNLLGPLISDTTDESSPEGLMGIKQSPQRRLVRKSVSNSLDIVDQSIEDGNLSLYHSQSSLVYEIMRSVDGIVPDDQIMHEPSMKNILELQVKWYKELVNQYNEEYREIDPSIDEMMGLEDISLTSDYKPRQHEHLGISALINIRLCLMATSAIYTKKLHSFNERKELELVRSTWDDLIEFACVNPPQASAVLIVQRYIEMAVYVMEKQGDASMFSIKLATVMRNGGYSIVEEAFDRVLSNPERTHHRSFRGLSRSLQWLPFEMHDHSDEYLSNAEKLKSDTEARLKSSVERNLSQAKRFAYILQSELTRRG